MKLTRVTSVVRAAGTHHWEGAPPEVAFLASPHRHLFTFRAEFGVGHGDREVEFFVAQNWIRAALRACWPLDAVAGYEFGQSSCEQLAAWLADALKTRFAAPVLAVEVWEDDENGARVEVLA